MAQRIEHQTSNLAVVGSNPTGRTTSELVLRLFSRKLNEEIVLDCIAKADNMPNCMPQPS